jgi:hypothetical protein
MNFENVKWLEQFHAKHGRPLKVLHIGNIANNAYNNAKILREIGVISDVICYDYYHVMGTPEWEDADFKAIEVDQLNPNWASIDLNGFKRPEWFVQGPLSLCIEYLLAKNQGNDAVGLNIWEELSEINKTTSPSNKSQVDLEWLNLFWKKIAYSLNEKNTFLASKRLDVFIYQLKPSNIMFYFFYAYFLIFINFIFINKIFKFIFNLDSQHKVDSQVDKILNIEIKIILKRINGLLDNIFLEANTSLSNQELKRSIDLSKLDKWKNLFSNYDVIIGYSTDGIYPLLTNTPYFAFEHGTLRDIPYQETVQGKLCAATYSMAKHVFVTNFDCKESAEFFAPNRYSLINHPFDENHSEGILGANELRNNLLQELDSDFLFFFPTRHDWVEGTGYADKANDIFLHAFGRLRKLGYRIGMVCCDWGQNTENSKKLLSDYNVEKYVKWGEPMAIIAFERTALACDCVVDQFKLGSFGGILFKAMAAGSPVMTYLNEEMLTKQFSEVPPVINCKNEQDIIEAVQSLFGKPELIDIMGIKSQEWIKNHHSKRDIINSQLTQFKLLMQEYDSKL